MSVTLPKPVLEAYCSNTLALFIGSGFSLGRDVQGNFPTWLQLPQRLLDACERLGISTSSKSRPSAVCSRGA